MSEPGEALREALEQVGELDGDLSARDIDRIAAALTNELHRDQFRRMTPPEVNDFLASVGSTWRVERTDATDRFQIDESRRWMVREYLPDQTARFRDPTDEEYAALAAPVAGGLDVRVAEALDKLGGMWSWNANGIPEDWNGWVAEAGRLLEAVVGRHAKEPYAASQPVAEEGSCLLCGNAKVGLAVPAHSHSTEDGGPAQSGGERPAMVAAVLAPGLPHSIEVGSVAGSPKLPHAYNVEAAEE